MNNGILVPIDFSNVTDLVVEEACRLATATRSKIWLVHVAPEKPDYVGVEPGSAYVRNNLAEQFHHEHQRLQEYEKLIRDRGLEVTAMLLRGLPGGKIMEEAQRLQPNLIVMGSHGHGALHHLLTGSVCEGILKRAACPVVIVPSREAAPKKEVLAAPAEQQIS